MIMITRGDSMYNFNGSAENTLLQLMSIIFVLIGALASAVLLKTTSDETTNAIKENGDNTIELMQTTKNKMQEMLNP